MHRNLVSKVSRAANGTRLSQIPIRSAALAVLLAPVAASSAPANISDIPYVRAGTFVADRDTANQAKVVPPILKPGTLPLISTARMTRFDPVQHGFRFTNTFQNVTGVFDIVVGGLCGGMVYSALDYFNGATATPTQSYRPVSGTTLESYIYNRHLKSFEGHMDKWVELHANPFGARNSEFFKWGLEGKPGGRLQELRAKIDAGQPVPLGLKSLSANPGEDHVVLAYGYDMGRYKGDLGANQTDLKIFVYNPNYGNKKTTLVPVPNEQKWCHVEADKHGNKPCWRSYFVQQNYNRISPPRISSNPVELRMSFKTGGDDLRGGNDNVSVRVQLTDGRIINADNVNKSKRWIDQSLNMVGISLPDDVRASSIRDITLTTSFGGGMGGDNWNLDQLVAKLHINDTEVTGCTINGRPVKRFTGDDKRFVTRFPCY